MAGSNKKQGAAMSVNSTPASKPNTKRLTHTAHPYTAADLTGLGTWISQNGPNLTAKSSWVNDSQADPVGMLSAIIDANTIEVTTTGGTVRGLTGLVDDNTYWGGTVTAGLMSVAAPIVSGAVPQSLGQAIGTTEFFVDKGARQSALA
jgi:hypothetical protein